MSGVALNLSLSGRGFSHVTPGRVRGEFVFRSRRERGQEALRLVVERLVGPTCICARSGQMNGIRSGSSSVGDGRLQPITDGYTPPSSAAASRATVAP